MSNVSNPNAPTYTNPLRNPAPTTHTQATGTTQAGQTVQVASTAQAPAHSSGIGDQIKKFFGNLVNKFRDWQAVRSLADQTFNATVAKPLQPQNFSKEDRSAASFAFVKNAANGTNADNVGSFLRSNDSGSALTVNVIANSNITSIARHIEGLIGNDIVALDTRSYGLAEDGSSDKSNALFPSFHNLPDGFETATAQQTVAKVDSLLCDLLGTPGNQQSIDTAAARYPQSVCDQLAIMHRAIDSSSASATHKTAMKTHAARDILYLRAVGPAIHVTAHNEAKASGRTEQLTSRQQANKALMFALNGKGMGQNDSVHPEVRNAGGHMAARWTPAFDQFVAAIVARADANVVAAAEQRGERVLRAAS